MAKINKSTFISQYLSLEQCTDYLENHDEYNDMMIHVKTSLVKEKNKMDIAEVKKAQETYDKAMVDVKTIANWAMMVNADFGKKTDAKTLIQIIKNSMWLKKNLMSNMMDDIRCNNYKRIDIETDKPIDFGVTDYWCKEYVEAYAEYLRNRKN